MKWGIFFLVSILIIVFFNSCESSVSKEVDVKASLKVYKEKYFQNYNDLYHLANDTLSSWVKDSLKQVKPLIWNQWMIDSILIFNKDSSIVFGFILDRSDAFKDSKMDDIHGLTGYKIRGNWYFILENDWVILREQYQDSIYTPLSFSVLSEIARDYISNYIIITDSGNVVIDEAVVKRKKESRRMSYCVKDCTDYSKSPPVYKTLDICKSEADVDKQFVLKYWEDRLDKISSKEILSIEEAIKVSVRPKEPTVEEKKEKETSFRRLDRDAKWERFKMFVFAIIILYGPSIGISIIIILSIVVLWKIFNNRISKKGN